jgi:hypothetical protein
MALRFEFSPEEQLAGVVHPLMRVNPHPGPRELRCVKLDVALPTADRHERAAGHPR